MRQYLFSLAVVELAACGSVEKSSPDAGQLRDAAVVGDDASVPPDSLHFASGKFSWEEIPQGMPMTPYTAPTGVVLSQPNPNPQDSSGLFVVDCNMDSGAFGFGCSTSRASVPDGLKFGVLANLGSTQKLIEYTFPADITSFSVAITDTEGTTGKPYAVAAVNASGADIDAVQIASVPIASWKANRATVSSAAGFRRVQIRNVGTVENAIALDDIEWIAK